MWTAHHRIRFLDDVVLWTTRACNAALNRFSVQWRSNKICTWLDCLPWPMTFNHQFYPIPLDLSRSGSRCVTSVSVNYIIIIIKWKKWPQNIYIIPIVLLVSVSWVNLPSPSCYIFNMYTNWMSIDWLKFEITKVHFVCAPTPPTTTPTDLHLQHSLAFQLNCLDLSTYNERHAIIIRYGCAVLLRGIESRKWKAKPR